MDDRDVAKLLELTSKMIQDTNMIDAVDELMMGDEIIPRHPNRHCLSVKYLDEVQLNKEVAIHAGPSDL